MPRYLSIYVYPPTYLPIYVYPPTYLPIYVYPPTYLPIYLPTYLPIYLYFRCIVEKIAGTIEGIVLAPTLGTMYWHDDDGEKESLKTARMDGTRADQVTMLESSIGLR